MTDYRVGFGFDIHRMSRKRKGIILGGVNIACSFGLVAVSDGDVVLHAVSDALCGACGLGDIGDYFPPSSQKSKNISSRKIVKVVLAAIKRRFRIVNIDVTIITEKPKLVVYKKKIVDSLTQIFSTPYINLKIKSKEGLDILGSKNSMSCIATVLVEEC
ncbi:MAG: 2-C-methyl-D-erythritol 2,4-cyclodiphosphate synthase [Candidatus Omnitrophota bacterium]|nr:MAG: 2-C-methyl-D-erythritol 2,4-cyclodiphosphate synthase [Candidatus Omnitrophota bacterium]